MPLLAALLLLEAAVTAVLNLDTAVVFVTPVLLHAARQRGVAEAPFLYGAVFMANSASLLLPGSNLTNLIVLAHEPVTGSTFAGPVRTRVGGRGRRHDRLPAARVPAAARRSRSRASRAAWRSGSGAGSVGIAVAAVLVLALPPPRAARARRRRSPSASPSRLRARHVLDATNPALLLGVLGIAVAARHARAQRRLARPPRRARRPLGVGLDRRRRLGAREQPAGRGGALGARAGAPARAPARARPRAEPRRDRVALGPPLAPGRPRKRREAVRCALHAAGHRARAVSRSRSRCSGRRVSSAKPAPIGLLTRGHGHEFVRVWRFRRPSRPRTQGGSHTRRYAAD